MNYEEMLNTQENVGNNRVTTPLGTFYRKPVSRKYRYVVQLRYELADSLVFCEGLRRDQQQSAAAEEPYQLGYVLNEDSGGIYEIELEHGNYQSLAQLLYNQPAVVAEPGFVRNFISALMDVTERLHEKGIFHLCYSPDNIFVRKGEKTPLLLCHGSSFLAMTDQRRLYQGFEDDVAPEVLVEGRADERSDVFGLGRFIEHLLESGNLGYDYKGVVKKATAEDPDKRYATVHEMRSALNAKRNTRRSMWLLAAACAVVAVAVIAFFGIIKEPTTVEFVDDNGMKAKPDPFQEEFDDEYVDDQEPYMDPEIALYLDSIEPMTDEEVKMLSDSIHVNEQLNTIFRRRFAQKARVALSPLYGTSENGMTENDYIAKSEQVMKDLYEYAEKLGKETGLNIEDANSVAGQIIAHLQAELQENIKRNGVITKSMPEE